VNQDFSVPSTAGMARRIMKLSQIASLVVDESVSQLAETDIVTESEFESLPNFTPTEDDRKAIQTIMDYGFRAIIPTLSVKKVVPPILAAAVLAKIDNIFIITPEPVLWRKQINAFGLGDKVIFFPSKEESKSYFYDPDLFKDKRDGLLIMDDHRFVSGPEGRSHNPVLAMDFQKTIHISNKCSFIEMETSIDRMFPGAPTDLLTNTSPLFKKRLAEQGFKAFKPEEVMFMFNIVSTYITSPQHDLDIDL
jgi:hypothetical protein